jgi:PST family polysaccharide transporter
MFSRLQSDLPQMRARLYRLTAASSAVVIPCFALSGLLAPDLLPFVLGEKWDPVVPLYQVLTLLGAVNAVAIFDRSVLIAAGRGQVAFLLTVGQAILGIVLVLAALDYGIMAIGIAIVARQYLYWPVRLWVLKRAIGASPTTYLLQWLRPAMAATAMIPAFLAIEHFGSPTWPTLLRIVVASGCGVCTYLLCLRLLSRRAFQEIVSTMKSLWQGRL